MSHRSTAQFVLLLLRFTMASEQCDVIRIRTIAGNLSHPLLCLEPSIKVRIGVILVSKNCLQAILLDTVAYEDMDKEYLLLFSLQFAEDCIVRFLASGPALILKYYDVLIEYVVLFLEEANSLFTFL